MIFVCNVRAIRYKCILFFYGLPRRVSFRSLRLRLRQCLLWCRVHVCCRVAVWPRICGAAHTCCRALYTAAHSHTAALHSAAHLYVAASHGAARAAKWSPFSVLPRSIVPRTCMLPRPMVPRGRPNGLCSLCCRVPWCRAGGQMVSGSLCCRVPWCRVGGQMVSVLCVAASHGAARAAKWSQFSVLPRLMVLRGRPNGLRFSVLPRPMVPRGRPNGLSSL